MPLRRAARQGREEFLRLLLLEKGVPADSRDGGGQMPLLFAVPNGHAPVVRALLQNGASVGAADKSGQTRLLCAVGNGHPAAVRVILENGGEDKFQAQAPFTGRDCHWQPKKVGYQRWW